MKKNIFLSCYVLIIICVFVGCGLKKQSLQNNINHVEEFYQKQEQKEDRITHLENEIINVKGVDTSNVVLMENAAIISITTQNGIEKSGFEAIRHNISNRVKQIYPDIKHVTVTIAPELVEKFAIFGEEESENKRDNVSNFRPVI